ncbi:hypothetical protein S83_032521, partial [Arachis hypogaea]
PESEFQPPISEVVQALVRLLQRANMSRQTTFGSDQIEGVMYPPYMMICEWEHNPC